jgi:hypothetical protein
MTASHLFRPHGSSARRATVLTTTLAGLGLLYAVTPGTGHADALPANCTGTTTITCTFDYNGTDGSDGSAQTWTVPAGVTSAHFDVYGAQGDSETLSGGRGGETSGTVTVTPGSTVMIRVGGQPNSSSSAGGYNGGGSGGKFNGAGGGGGASDVRVGGDALGNRVLVAGGGGGASNGCFTQCGIPGAGGGSVGVNGTSSPPDTSIGGDGGTQSGPGLSFDPGDGAVGANAQSPIGNDMRSSGAGGGGFYGGGAGAIFFDNSNPVAIGTGGGGSGFVHPDPAKVTSGQTITGMNEGNGSALLTYTAPPKSDQAINFPALPNRSLTDSPFTISGVTGGGSANLVTFTAGGPCTVSGADVTLTTTGICTITAHQAGDATYNPAPDVARSFTVTPAPPPSLSIDDRSTPEGNSGQHALTFHVTLSHAAGVQVKVHWATDNGSAHASSDYVAGSGTLTLAVGQTSRTVSVQIKGDHSHEANETFKVKLTNPHNATISDNQGVGTIQNDD